MTRNATANEYGMMIARTGQAMGPSVSARSFALSKRAMRWGFAAALCLAAAGPAAANLVTNGGFEAFTPISLGPTPPGTFNSPDGWFANFGTVVGGGQFSGVNQSTLFGNPAAPHSGNNAFDFGTVSGDTATLSQTLATVAGQRYTVSFWLANDASDVNAFSAVWSGATDVNLLTLANDPGRPYGLHTFSVLADSNLTDIVFSVTNDATWWHLDDVSVSRVPEPGDLLLLATGCVGLIGFRQRAKASSHCYLA